MGTETECRKDFSLRAARPRRVVSCAGAFAMRRRRAIPPAAGGCAVPATSCAATIPPAAGAAARSCALVALLASSAVPGICLAHSVDAPAAGWAAGIDPVGMLLLALVGLAHARGQWRLAQRATRAGPRRETAFFWLGWGATLVALAPPLDAWAARSFAAHMVQHELIMLVGAPLLVLARPLGVMLWGLPTGLARAVASLAQSRPMRAGAAWLCAPLPAWTIHAVVLWGWHVPAAFEAGLASDAVHWLQHASFFAAALLFWWSVAAGGHAGARRGAAFASVFTTALHTGALGALLTFSGRIWYPSYAEAANPWGLTALDDQQLGGLLMWVPGGMVFFAAGLVLAAGWLAGGVRNNG